MLSKVRLLFLSFHYSTLLPHLWLWRNSREHCVSFLLELFSSLKKPVNPFSHSCLSLYRPDNTARGPLYFLRYCFYILFCTLRKKTSMVFCICKAKSLLWNNHFCYGFQDQTNQWLRHWEKCQSFNALKLLH